MGKATCVKRHVMLQLVGVLWQGSSQQGKTTLFGFACGHAHAHACGAWLPNSAPRPALLQVARPQGTVAHAICIAHALAGEAGHNQHASLLALPMTLQANGRAAMIGEPCHAGGATRTQGLLVVQHSMLAPNDTQGAMDACHQGYPARKVYSCCTTVALPLPSALHAFPSALLCHVRPGSSTCCMAAYRISGLPGVRHAVRPM